MDPVQFFQIQIPISISYLDMFFDAEQKKYFFLWDFLAKCKHLMMLKITDKKVILTKLYLQLYANRKLEL